MEVSDLKQSNGECLELRDSNGKVRILLSACDKLPVIAMCDEKGMPRIVLELDGAEGRLCFRDINGIDSCVVGSNDSKTFVRLSHQDARPGTMLVYDSAQKLAEIGKYDAQGRFTAICSMKE